MVVYDIDDNRIRLRQVSGDQFEFLIEAGSEQPSVRLLRQPRWASGRQPPDAEFRVYLASMAAKGLAREARLLR